MKVLKLSMSTLSNLLCSTKAALVGLGFEGAKPNFKMILGGLLHEVLAKHFRGESKQACLAHLTEKYLAYEEEGVLGEDLPPAYTLGNLVILMDTYLSNHPIESFPFSVEGEGDVEISFEQPLGVIRFQGEDYLVVVIGQIDLKGSIGEDVWAVEHKFTGRALNDQLARGFYLDSQNTCYQWVLQEQLGREIRGAFVNVIKLDKVPDSNRECKEHVSWCRNRGLEPIYENCGRLHLKTETIPVERDQEIIEQWKNDVLTLAHRYLSIVGSLPPEGAGVQAQMERVQAMPTEGRFYRMTCEGCEFFHFCGAGKPPEQAMMLKRRVKKEEQFKPRSGIYEEAA